jgi:uncharacterized membrane protein YwaF
LAWGFFSVTHIISLFIAAAIIVGLYFALKNKTAKTQTLVLGILSLSGIAAIIYNLVAWNSPLEYLPFHLCSLNAMVLPFAVLTRNKRLNNLLLLWSFGAILAIVVNSAQANYEIFSWTFAIYYFPHVLEFGVPVLMFKFGLVEKDVRCIKTTLGMTLATYTIAHCINLVLNEYLYNNNILDYTGNLIQVNYMYSIVPENPIFVLFYQLIPYEYWYMFMSIPIIIVYLVIVYVKEIRESLARRGKLNIEKSTASRTN